MAVTTLTPGNRLRMQRGQQGRGRVRGGQKSYTSETTGCMSSPRAAFLGPLEWRHVGDRAPSETKRPAPEARAQSLSTAVVPGAHRYADPDPRRPDRDSAQSDTFQRLHVKPRKRPTLPATRGSASCPRCPSSRSIPGRSTKAWTLPRLRARSGTCGAKLLSRPRCGHAPARRSHPALPPAYLLGLVGMDRLEPTSRTLFPGLLADVADGPASCSTWSPATRRSACPSG